MGRSVAVSMCFNDYDDLSVVWCYAT